MSDAERARAYRLRRKAGVRDRPEPTTQELLKFRDALRQLPFMRDELSHFTFLNRQLAAELARERDSHRRNSERLAALRAESALIDHDSRRG
jgi:GrpB-like predicted nucleotidyltransferase (UPF0157 family)